MITNRSFCVLWVKSGIRPFSLSLLNIFVRKNIFSSSSPGYSNIRPLFVEWLWVQRDMFVGRIIVSNTSTVTRDLLSAKYTPDMLLDCLLWEQDITLL